MGALAQKRGKHLDCKGMKEVPQCPEVCKTEKNLGNDV